MNKNLLAKNDDASQKVFIDSALTAIGIIKVNILQHHLGKVSIIDNATRTDFLDQIAKLYDI